MKKGQIQPIFTWIFVLILAVSILIFGIDVVKKGDNLKDEALLANFFKNLDSKVESFYYLDIGSSGREKFLLPSSVNKICFTNQTGTLSGGPDLNYLQGLSSFSNVFVFPLEFGQTSFNVTNFVVKSENPTCIDVSGGRVELRLENLGNYVEIS